MTKAWATYERPKMASTEATTAWTTSVTPNIESFLRNISQSFSDEEMKEAINWTRNVLQGEYTKLPEDDLFQCFHLLNQHGRLSETDTSGIEFYADRFCRENNKNLISKKIEDFKKTYHCDQDESGAELFVGRDADIESIVAKLQPHTATSESFRGVNLHGEGGVGKTVLAEFVAKRLCTNRECRSITINVREISDIKHVYFDILRKLQQPVIFPDADRVYTYIKNLQNDLILVFDNTEDFLLNGEDFKSFLRDVFKHDQHKKIQILLTSRLELKDVSEISNYVVRPFKQEASNEILLKKTGLDLSVSLMAEIAKICCNKPLLLKGFSVILKEKLAPEDKLLADIEKNVARAKKEKSVKGKPKQKTMKDVKERTPLGYLNNNDWAVLREMFDKLSLSLRSCLIKLSLFCRDFYLPAAQHMIGRSIKESRFYVNILISKGFLETKKGDSGEKLFSLHPLTQEFLKEERLNPEYQGVYQEGKDLFCKFFKKQLKEMINYFDVNFIKVFSDFEIERPNFEQLLELTPEKEFLMILPDVRQFYLLPCLLEPLLTVGTRRLLFRNLAEAAIKEGEFCAVK